LHGGTCRRRRGIRWPA